MPIIYAKNSTYLLLCLVFYFFVGSFSAFCLSEQENDGFVPKQVRLSLNDAYLMVLRNNVDISIKKYDPLIQTQEINAQKSIFDPSYKFGLKYNDAKTPLSSINRITTGFSGIETEGLEINNGVSGLLPFGAKYDVSFKDLKSEGTTTMFDSEYDTIFGINLSQPLLRNFGFDTNLAKIKIAKINKNISKEELRQTLISKLFEAQNRYWEYVFAIQDLEVKKESLELAKTLSRDNKKRVEVGVLPPIEITQSEAGVASREEGVLIGQQAVSDRENDLKTLLYPNPEDIIYNVVTPVDTPKVERIPLSLKKSVDLAVKKRPEYLIIQKRIDVLEVNTKFFKNQKMPEVNFVGGYNLRGIDGNFPNAVDTVASEDMREWVLGVEVNVPLGNRERESRYRISKLELKKLEFEKKKIEINIVREISSAIANIRTNLKRVEATVASRELAMEALTSEIRKLETGASTSHIVLQFQEDLSKAKVQEIRAVVDLMKSIFELYKDEGTLLDVLKIQMDE